VLSASFGVGVSGLFCHARGGIRFALSTLVTYGWGEFIHYSLSTWAVLPVRVQVLVLMYSVVGFLSW